MKKILLFIILISFLFGQSLTKGWYNDSFEVPDSLWTKGISISGGTPGTGKVLTSDPTGIGTWQTATGFSDPMTTRGDIIIRNAANATARLGIGANAFVLKSDGTDISWAALLTNSAGLAGELNDETGTGYSVFSDSPLFTTDIEIRKDGIGTSQLDTYGTLLSNTTAATAADSIQSSPPIVQAGTGWKTDATAASQKVEFRSWVKPKEGTSAPTGDWFLQSSINDGAYSDLMTVNSGGNVGIGEVAPDSTLEVKGSVHITDHLRVEENATVNSNYVMEGYTTGRNVMRVLYLRIEDGTNANTLKLTTTSKFNHTAISVVDNVAKNATTGGYTLSADGKYLTIENSILEGTVVGVGNTEFAILSYTEILTVESSLSGGDIAWIAVRTVAAPAVSLDLTVVIDASGGGSSYVLITYWTNS